MIIIICTITLIEKIWKNHDPGIDSGDCCDDDVKFCEVCTCIDPDHLKIFQVINVALLILDEYYYDDDEYDGWWHNFLYFVSQAANY